MASDDAGSRANTALSHLLRSWRERLDPASIPVPAVGGRRKKTVSQEDLARLIGVSSVWYGRLERGEKAGYSFDFLERTARALRLDEAERTMLYLHAVGHAPRPRGTPASVRLTGPLRRVVEEQPWPAYISDESWDLIAHNNHMAKWFPWVELGLETNIMRWVLTDPEARRQLCDWESDWVPPMLSQLRVARARQPSNTRLAELIEDVLTRNELARGLWEREPLAHLHPDGDRRRLHVPDRDDVVRVELVTLAPLRATEARLMMLIPISLDFNS